MTEQASQPRTAAMGDNNPPPYDPTILEEHRTAASAFSDEAAPWLKPDAVTTDEDAAKLNDVIAKARKLWKAADDARKTEKKPHDDAAAGVQKAFSPVLTVLKTDADRLKSVANAFLEDKAAAKRAEDARQAAEAKRQREEAERLAAAASARGDTVGEVAAAEALKESEKAEKDAARAAKQRVNIGSATGGGRTMSQRTVRTAEIFNINLVFRHFADHPEVREVLQRLANAEIRAGSDVPGAEKKEEMKVA